ncbi:MAG: adenylate/guanylate cyclase domain-containing protein [Xanthomonadales bacterium]|nr:adenylate/guanylate cyclase domain-containing protein [Xanthomonadales bacterium]
MPALLFGNAYTVLAVMYITWPVAMTSGAVYGFVAELILLLPMVHSYFRLRGRPRPERVSRRRIRSIVIYSLLLGLAWGVTFYLMNTEIGREDGIALIVVMYLLIYGSVAMMPSLPKASIAYMSPIIVSSFFGAFWHDILSLAWLLLLYFGALSAVGLSMWQNWHDLGRSVRLRLENLQAQRITEQSKEVLERVSGQLAKYISPQLYRAILDGKQQVSIASQRKKLTIFFSDIAGFTETTDQLESEELTAVLNQYLTEMSKIAQEYGANFDKFIGDAIVLYFGDPETRGVRQDASDCVRMAIAMQRRMRELQSEWRDMGLERPFEIRIGINTGYCTVGNFGSEDRMDYTIIGGEVNLAARLEYEAEAGGILLAYETWSLVKDWVRAEEAETITVKGFARPITTYRVRGIQSEPDDKARVFRHEQEGLNVILDRDRLGAEEKVKAAEALRNALRVLEKD